MKAPRKKKVFDVDNVQRLRNTDEAAKFRNHLLGKQNHIDPITGEIIKDPVLDHAHFGEQRCRAVLQRECNSFEGKVQNAFNRYMKHLTDVPLSEVLRNLADYLERDNSKLPIHHTAITVDTGKFKRLPAEKQREILESFDIVPESNNLKRTKQARKLILDGRLDMNSI